MQHIDEGLLQAWLDGTRSGLAEEDRAAVEEHLEQCRLCAARVRALRDTNDEAVELLAHIQEAGGEEIPAFGTVIARGQALDTGYRRRRWQMATGWAASVVVALGVGWLANEMWRSRPEQAAYADRLEADAPAAGPDEAPRDAETAAGAEERAPLPANAGDTNPADTAGPGVRMVQRADPDALGVQAGEPEVRVAQSTGPGARLADTANRAGIAEPPALQTVVAARARAVPMAADTVVTAEASSRVAVRGRVTDAASGRPLESAQVFLPGSPIGTLTNREGQFQLIVGPLPDSARDLRVNVQLLGYGEESRELRIGSRDTVLSDFRMLASAVTLDEIVVTATAAAARRSGLPATVRTLEMEAPTATLTESAGSPLTLTLLEEDSTAWRAVPRTEAEALIGFPVRAVPGLEVVGLKVGILQETPVLRVVQLLEDSGRLVLLQATRDLRLQEREGSGFASIRLEGGVFVAGRAALPGDSIRILLARVR